MKERCEKVYDIPREQMRVNESARRVYSDGALAPTMNTCGGGSREPKVAVRMIGGVGERNSADGTRWHEQDRIYDESGAATAIAAEQAFHPYYGGKKMGRLRIRKLTEGECYRLMGFEKKDEEACKKVGQSASSIYHQAGDSIVTTVLMGIFGELIGADYERAIEEYADRLHGEIL